MYLVPIIYVSELTYITFKRDSHQVIPVPCYPEALLDAFLCLQVFAFLVTSGNNFMYSKKIPWVRAVTFSATNSLTQGKGF